MNQNLVHERWLQERTDDSESSPFRTLTLAALVLSALVAFVTPVGAITNCSVSAEDQAIDSEEQQLLNLINQYRDANGKTTLSFDLQVTRAAAWFSRDMASKNYIPDNHVDSIGLDPGNRLRQCAAGWRRYAENIAAGNQTAQGTFDQWRNSPGHNANMLSDGVTRAGIGRAYNTSSTYRWYWTLNVTAPGTTNANVAAADPGDTITVSATGVASANTTYRLRFGRSEDTCHTSPLMLGGNAISDSNFNIAPVARRVPANTTSGVRWLCWVALGDTDDRPAAARVTVF